MGLLRSLAEDNAIKQEALRSFESYLTKTIFAGFRNDGDFNVGWVRNTDLTGLSVLWTSDNIVKRRYANLEFYRHTRFLELLDKLSDNASVAR